MHSFSYLCMCHIRTRAHTHTHTHTCTLTRTHAHTHTHTHMHAHPHTRTHTPQITGSLSSSFPSRSFVCLTTYCFVAYKTTYIAIQPANVAELKPFTGLIPILFVVVGMGLSAIAGWMEVRTQWMLNGICVGKQSGEDSSLLSPPPPPPAVNDRVPLSHWLYWRLSNCESDPLSLHLSCYLSDFSFLYIVLDL